MDSLIIFCAKDVIVLVVLGWLLTLWRINKDLRRQFIVATVLAGIFALVLSRIASKLYYDPRPFVSQHIKPLIDHAADNGFPSDHALFTMTLTAVAYFYSRKLAALMLIGTILVGVARVLAHVHSPIDIAFGWLIGCVGAGLGFYVARWALLRNRRRSPQQV
jgi:undecaprenyl-diphosphatase